MKNYHQILHSLNKKKNHKNPATIFFYSFYHLIKTCLSWCFMSKGATLFLTLHFLLAKIHTSHTIVNVIQMI